MTMNVEMTTIEALEIALEALEERAMEFDTASPEGHTARLALDVLTTMLTAAQTGARSVAAKQSPD